MKVESISKKILFLIWIGLWIPLSSLFPNNPHFPIGGVFSPITALILPFVDGSNKSSINFDWWHVYFPALFFWGVGAIFIFLCQRLLNRNL